MKLFLFIFIFTFSLFAQTKSHFTPLIERQLSFIKQLNDDNVTQEMIMDIAKKQEILYSSILDEVLANKNTFINKSNPFDAEIYALQKVIKLNKRLGNKYATLRDEALVKSYKILNAQNKMVKNILKALDKHSFEKFQEYMHKQFIINQEYTSTISDVNYDNILQIESSAKTLNQAKKNINDFYAIVEMNSDVIKYLSMFDKKMYKLNKYSRYNLINSVIFLNNLPFIKGINNFIKSIKLDVVKLLFMLSIIGLIYLIRKYLYGVVEANIYKIQSLKKYSTKLLDSIRKPIDFIVIFINVEIIVYIYNDFAGVGESDIVFNITYVLILTYIVYKVVNLIAGIKIHEINITDKNIKREMINVGIKIINFTILIFGLLAVLYFAGANLTAILSGLGIGGFAVALAAKDSLANFFGTLSILLSDVFSQGDWIVVDGKEGTVVEIGLRVTTLRTFDNAIIAIPNATLANKDVKNWNKRLLGRRIKMSLGVKYDSKYTDIQNAIEEIRSMLDQHPKIATEKTKYAYAKEKSAKLVSKEDEKGVKKTLLVYLDAFSDSSINILIYCFSKSTNWAEWLAVKEDVMYKIMQIFEKNNLEFAFPSMSIYSEKDK